MLKLFLFSLSMLFYSQLIAQTTNNFQYPHTFYRLTFSDFNRLPIRGIESYLQLFPGIIEVNSKFHLRASRANDIAYLLDGFTITNPLNKSNNVPLIPEAIEYYELHTGAFGAVYGRTTGGVVHSKMRTGGDEYAFSADLRSDNFAKPGNQFLKTNSYGYRNVVLTAGGPLPLGLKFFAAGQHNYWRNRQPMFLEEFRFDSLREDWWSVNPWKPLPRALEYKSNNLPNNWAEDNTIQANLTFSSDKLQSQLIGSFTHDRQPQGSQWPLALDNYYRQKRNMMLTNYTSFVGLRARHDLLTNLSYNISLGYFNSSSELTDPDFGSKWQLFTDSIANAKKGYDGFRWRYLGPYPFYTLSSKIFYHPNSPNNRYEKSNDQSFQSSIQAVAKLTDSWELRSGVASEWLTLRKYSIQNISDLMGNLYGHYGNPPRLYKDEYERRISLIRSGKIDHYGYNVDGQIINSGFDAPRKPAFSSAYVENIFSGLNYSINAGLRFERYDLQLPSIPDFADIPYDRTYDWIDESRLSKSKPTNLLLPRLAFTTQPNERTNVYFALGKYARYVPLEEVLITTRNLFQMLTAGYLRYGLKEPLLGQYLQPEQTMHYEAGISHSFHKMLSADLILYYKFLSKQSQLAWADTSIQHSRMLVLKNEGEGNVRGFELAFNFQPEKRFNARLSYSLTDTRGSGSDSRWNWKSLASEAYSLETQPQNRKASYPFSYSPTHNGNLLIEFKFDDGDGWLLDGLRIVQLASFNSGRRYTKEMEPKWIYSFHRYEIGVATILEPTLSLPSEPPNASETPWYFNVDLRIEKVFLRNPVRALLAIDILNIFNRRHILNVYPTTGTPTDDGWLSSRDAEQIINYYPGYEQGYRVFNLQNRWAYMNATGYDIYGTPRQIRINLKIEV